MSFCRTSELNVINNKIMIDANICLFLFSEKFREDYMVKVNKYSEFIKKIFNKSELYITIMIISEVINTYSQESFKIFRENTNNQTMKFKDYRKTDDFKEAIGLIINQLKQFIKSYKITLLNIDEVNSNINTIFDEFTENCDNDYNDLILKKLCEINKLSLLTDDFDFSKYKTINIISENNNYFKL